MNFERRSDGIEIPLYAGLTTRERVELEDKYIPKQTGLFNHEKSDRDRKPKAPVQYRTPFTDNFKV